MTRSEHVARLYWLLFVNRMDTMFNFNQTVHLKVEAAIRRHYKYEEKPLLPRVKWRQKNKRKLPCEMQWATTPLGYLVHNSSLHYQLKQTEYVLFFRRPGKIITQRYIEHICKELGYYLA